MHSHTFLNAWDLSAKNILSVTDALQESPRVDTKIVISNRMTYLLYIDKQFY